MKMLRQSLLSPVQNTGKGKGKTEKGRKRETEIRVGEDHQVKIANPYRAFITFKRVDVLRF